MGRACLVVLILLIAPVAAAQTHAPPPARTFGAGFGVGVGFQTFGPYAVGPGDSGQKWVISVGSFELSAFIDDHLSIDFSASLFWTVFSAVLGDLRATGTVFLDWSLGDRTHRLLIGPGLGVSGRTSESSPPTPGPIVSQPGGIELRVAGLLGYEYIRDDQSFGFRVVTRPWISFGGGTSGFDLGGGGMLEALFMFYAP